jgi:hypothetical protein
MNFKRILQLFEGEFSGPDIGFRIVDLEVTRQETAIYAECQYVAIAYYKSGLEKYADFASGRFGSIC